MLALTSLFGLPAHPLLVHIPVVLIPLGALGAVLMCWPRLRHALGWWVCGLVLLAGVATQLAISTGEGLEEHVRETDLVETHIRIGENVRPWLLLMFLTLVGVMVVDRLVRRGSTAERPDGPRWTKSAGVVLAALSIVFSAMSVYWIYRIGHSGSKAVWHPTQVKIDAGASRGDGDDG
jgi:uncharacterized membrane protein